MTSVIIISLILFTIIIVVGQLFNQSTMPSSLLLVMTGMVLSIIPGFIHVELNPGLVLNVFLPLLIYQISSFSSWKEIKKNIRPITLLSIGHVIFMTIIVALIMHALLPGMNWPLAFILGAVLSPPDDVAIVSIAEKIRIPRRIVTILEGEGLFNDATALLLFKFSLIALVTHEFVVWRAVSDYFTIIIGEAAFGFLAGFAIGELRLKITSANLHMIASIMTPFAVYVSAEMMGGSGVLATAITGFIISNRYAVRFTPEFRLFSRALWPTFSFAIQSILFLLVGLDMRDIIINISTISPATLFFYAILTVMTLIIGRFIWVYGGLAALTYLRWPPAPPKESPPWRAAFVVAWSGMRGAISLAAALAVPRINMQLAGVDAKDLLVFLVFCVIAVTFIFQSLSLPWVLKRLGLHRYGQDENYNEHILELKARLKMANSVLKWLVDFEKQSKDNDVLYHEVKMHIQEYQLSINKLKKSIADHNDVTFHDEKLEIEHDVFLLTKMIEIEKNTLFKLWDEEKINVTVLNKLLLKLDHRTQHLVG